MKLSVRSVLLALVVSALSLGVAHADPVVKPLSEGPHGPVLFNEDGGCIRC